MSVLMCVCARAKDEAARASVVCTYTFCVYHFLFAAAQFSLNKCVSTYRALCLPPHAIFLCCLFDPPASSAPHWESPDTQTDASWSNYLQSIGCSAAEIPCKDTGRLTEMVFPLCCSLQVHSQTCRRAGARCGRSFICGGRRGWLLVPRL